MANRVCIPSISLPLVVMALASNLVATPKAEAIVDRNEATLAPHRAVAQNAFLRGSNYHSVAENTPRETGPVQLAQVIYYPYLLPLDFLSEEEINAIGGPSGDAPATAVTGSNSAPSAASDGTEPAGATASQRSDPAHPRSTAQTVHTNPPGETAPYNTTAGAPPDAAPDHQPDAALVEPHLLGQTASVADLSDVTPNDWAFAALQQMVETYGCLKGFPDGTFRGQQSLSRFEFAAAINECLNNFLAIYGQANPEDAALIATIQRLNQEFDAELSQLENRVDLLETSTAELQAQQFSTTMKLYGEAIFGLAFAEGGNPPGLGSGNPILGYSSQLGLVGSFTGTDLLRISLASGNFANGAFLQPGSLNTYMALTSFQSDSANQVELNALEYRFAGFDDQAVFTIKPVGFSLSSVLSSNSPYASSGLGAISRFGSESPLFKIGSLDSGVGFDVLLANRARLQFGYGARDAESPLTGLFNSRHRTLGTQLLLNPVNEVRVGLAYINGFSEDGRLDTFTGSFNADTSGTFNEPSVIHAVNGTLQWQFGDFLLSGWGGVAYTDSLPSNARAVTTTYLGALGVRDLLGEGDMLTFMVGQPPKLIFGTNIERIDEATALHFETFYRFPVTERIHLTPGVYWVTNPGHIAANNTIFVGTLRMTLRF